MIIRKDIVEIIVVACVIAKFFGNKFSADLCLLLWKMHQC